MLDFITVKLGKCQTDGNCSGRAESYACQVLFQFMFGESLAGSFTNVL
jgi:hypothetical protein